MSISSLVVRQFRCFENFSCSFDRPFVIIEGANGTGKTSLLEALHYACYLRSFRTHLHKEITFWETDGFAIELAGELAGSDKSTGECKADWHLKIVARATKRTITCDNQPLKSFKELFGRYRVVSITDDDMELIRGAPEVRRLFFDQALVLLDPSFVEILRKHRAIVQQRNALFIRGIRDSRLFQIWTERLQESSEIIRSRRVSFLEELEKRTTLLSNQYLSNARGDRPQETDEALLGSQYKQASWKEELREREYAFKRSLFGAHLDDCIFYFRGKRSRSCASRGQQKLLVYLIKLAQVQMLAHPTYLLIDDFMTDFDRQRREQLIALIQATSEQCFCTTPDAGSLLSMGLSDNEFQVITLASAPHTFYPSCQNTGKNPPDTP